MLGSARRSSLTATDCCHRLVVPHLGYHTKPGIPTIGLQQDRAIAQPVPVGRTAAQVLALLPDMPIWAMAGATVKAFRGGALRSAGPATIAGSCMGRLLVDGCRLVRLGLSSRQLSDVSSVSRVTPGFVCLFGAGIDKKRPRPGRKLVVQAATTWHV